VTGLACAAKVKLRAEIGESLLNLVPGIGIVAASGGRSVAASLGHRVPDRTI
jgi:hypothetical protein